MAIPRDPVTNLPLISILASEVPEEEQVNSLTNPDVFNSVTSNVDPSLQVDTGARLVEPIPASMPAGSPLVAKMNPNATVELPPAMRTISQAIPTDPLENLSKNQRRALAFMALADAGASIQGREGGNFQALLGSYTERADMERKRQAAVLKRQMTERLLGRGDAGGGMSGFTDEMLINAAGAGLIEPAAVKIELDRRKEKKNDLLNLAGKYATIDLIVALENNPNLDQILGAEGTIRGVIDKIAPAFQEDYSELMRRVEQLQGGVFKEAFQSLRGGGQITEKEGEKASAALARLSTAQGEKAFRRALAEYKFYITQGIARLNGEDIPLDNFYVSEEPALPEAGNGADDDVISDEDLETMFD